MFVYINLLFMKNIIVVLVFFLILLVTFSCKKEQPPVPEPSPITYPNYSQLKIGNYWVYERIEIDTNGNETSLGVIDTCYIEKDTLIDNVKYFKYVRPPYLNMETTTFIRDSLHYLVTSKGRIIFSSLIFGEVFREFEHPQGYYELHEWMTDKDSTINVPYGSFNTINFQQIFYMNEPFQDQGNPRYLNYRYSKDIGIISETLPWLFSNPNYIERRLVDYHLE